MAVGAFVGPMAAPRASFETTLTVPTRHLPTLLERLSRAGLTVLDTGARTTTDEGVDAEATVLVSDVLSVTFDEGVPLGIAP